MTVPNPQRREEILDAAERRFQAQGYLATSVAELIADTGIAKGTFYHHFSSKEQVMEAVIDRQVSRLREQVELLAGQRDVPALQRVLGLFSGLVRPPESEGLATELERDGNELLHLRALNATSLALMPTLAQIVADGVAEGTMQAAHPEAAAAALLAIIATLVDADLFGWVRHGSGPHLAGLLDVGERVLGLPAGSFAPLAHRLVPGEPS